MLKPKMGICIDCPPGSAAKYLTAERCQTHYWQHRRKVSEERNKARTQEVSKEDQQALVRYYQHHNANNSWICENCNATLRPSAPKVASSCQAHIVPKQHFKSVQAVLENHMTLGGLFQPCRCHAEYDASWEKAQGMHIFTIAKERFMTFQHLILPAEYKYLPDVFKKLVYVY